MRKNRKNLAIDSGKCYDTAEREVSWVLIEYRVKNFRSFKDEAVLSLVADNNRELSETNVFKQGKFELLKCAAIYGPNASGKSNLIRSFSFFKDFFNPSSNIEEKLNKFFPNFWFNIKSRDMPISYELSFFLGGIRYRYGLEVSRNGIESEYLYFVPRRQEARYFSRKRDKIYLGTHFENKKVLDIIQPDPYRPFLYTLGQLNVKQLERVKDIIKYLMFYIRSAKLPDLFFRRLIEKLLSSNPNNNIISKDEAVNFLRSFDIAISDISVERVEINMDSDKQLAEIIQVDDESVEKSELLTFMHHTLYDEHKNALGEVPIPLPLESQGTIKLYSLLYPIFHIMKNGGLLLIDEIESSLHPIICKRIIQMFNDPKFNPKNAQLIFTTHNTNLMDSALLRRDQIYFVEKDKYGASSLYALYDLDLDIRNNFNYEKNYLAGRFGAVPYLNDFSPKFTQ